MELAMRSARPGSVAATACATPLSADAFGDSSVMELAMRSASARSRAARSGSVAASAFATLAQRRCLPGLVGDGVGDAFGRGRGRWQPAPAATPLSADAFRYSSVMELAMRSASVRAARSGSVAATAVATPLSAYAFPHLSVMELAMRSASTRSRAARSGRYPQAQSPSPPRPRHSQQAGHRQRQGAGCSGAGAEASTRSIAATRRPASERKLSCRIRTRYGEPDRQDSPADRRGLA